MKIKTTFNGIEEMREWANFIAAVDTQKVSTVEPEIKITVGATEPMDDLEFVKAPDGAKYTVQLENDLPEGKFTPVDKAEKAADKIAAEKLARDYAKAEEAAAEEAKAKEVAAAEGLTPEEPKPEEPVLTYDDVINRIKNMKINGYSKIAADVAAWKTAGNYPSLKEMSAEQLQLVAEFLDTKEV